MNADKPKISVVMSVYNHENFVAKAIDSVLEQTFCDFELIILDNGSTDKSGYIIKGFSDTRMRVIREEKNIGAYWGIEKCRNIAEGKYIAFIGSDDIWEHSKLEKQYEFMEKNPEYGASFTEVKLIDGHGQFLDWSPFFYQTKTCLG